MSKTGVYRLKDRVDQKSDQFNEDKSSHAEKVTASLKIGHEPLNAVVVLG